jgi:hypothetical protein
VADADDLEAFGVAEHLGLADEHDRRPAIAA